MSSPALCAYSSPSTTPIIPDAISVWFAIFVCCPAPGGPMCTMFLPTHWNTGRTASKTCRSPPTMIESRASRAPTSPPDTGASSECTPRSAAALAIRTASDGSDVVRSTTIVPGRAPARTPFGPRYTDSTSEG
eukprot:Amastigsp_a176671_8.p2 type:complete len:133 gc:universal Amastigsp_a176671_8:318-716(+)